ncbi:thioesterase domain-containing protein [Umezawaea sp. Da 62-37]|uniref:thioesterase II family protein n=1 Tax=Umezawaea sp. Da 62-37 TaxID=3075927 RepID=UPI0028F71400|nr:thioesterase domain-containing protein [Umezawaea sp. Da 62-37]WNV84699.1 thioesterase domain-containing protein [Umezawaea sp. Da 62-37]
MSAPATPQRILLRKLNPDSPARIFCFPYSGVGASMYNRWPAYADDAEICLVQPPGRENRIKEPHYGTYEQLADQLADQLAPHFDRPFGFFGHCGGALPGFALAVELRQRGLPTPDRLFISSQVAPHDGPFGRFLELGNAQLAVELAAFAKRLGGTPSPDMIAMSLRVMRKDVDANKAYHLDEPVVLPSAIDVISWRDDVEIRPEQSTGWQHYAEPGRYRQVVLEGEHHSFLDAPPALLGELAAGMAAAVEGRKAMAGGTA